MKAVRFHEFGGTDVLRYEDVERPVPAAGQVLVEVAATTFNPADASLRAGAFRDVFPVALPHTLGLDVAGRIAELGEGVTGWSVGDAVFGWIPIAIDGAAAEYVAVSADLLAAAPGAIPLAQAAALPTGGLTAWQALFEQADLRAGQRILINGAGGGVGGVAVQLAKDAGAYVIATASPRSAAAIRGLGADEVVDYTSAKLADALTEPVDVVFNLVAQPPEQLAELAGLVRPGGVIVSITAPVPVAEDSDVRSVRHGMRPDAAQLAAIAAKADAGTLRPDVSVTYPLSDVAGVHRLHEAGEIRGKVLITVKA
ncbi:MAG: NADP-dependent oxidoreductase [Actinocrinis sp.]